MSIKSTLLLLVLFCTLSVQGQYWWYDFSGEYRVPGAPYGVYCWGQLGTYLAPAFNTCYSVTATGPYASGDWLPAGVHFVVYTSAGCAGTGYTLYGDNQCVEVGATIHSYKMIHV